MARYRNNERSMSDEKSKSVLRSRRTLIIVLALVVTIYYFVLRSPNNVSSDEAPKRPACDQGAPRANVQNGSYCGVHSDSYNQDFFLGVPYAEPPIEDRRFCRPQPLVSSFSGLRPATNYPRHCLGYGGDQEKYEASEDCLYLNIVRPRRLKGQNADDFKHLPVAVWFHGGGFTMGGTADLRYNLSFIVQEGVNVKKPFIGISVNYRLSGWGFLTSEEMVEKGETNLGLRDQRAALHWIRENIGAFGGDADKVTIWGQSAGATSVGFHMTAYGGRDDHLFRAAVMESGGAVFYRPFRPVQSYDSQYQTVLQKTNCEGGPSALECLQKAPVHQLDDVFRAQGNVWGPIVDGDFIAKPTSEQVAGNEFVKVPILTGANTDEGTSFSPKGFETPSAFENLAGRRFKGEDLDKIIEAYPDDPCFGTPDLGCERLGSPYGPQFRRIAAFEGDSLFIANRRLMCETWAAAGLPAYCYRFNAHAAGVPREIGVPHVTEVAFVFSNIKGYGFFKPARTPPFEGKGPEYADLARFMSRSWASFFVDLDPNSFRGNSFGLTREIPQWPTYSVSTPQLLVLDVTTTGEVIEPGVVIEEDTFREEGIRLINQNNANDGR